MSMQRLFPVRGVVVVAVLALVATACHGHAPSAHSTRPSVPSPVPTSTASTATLRISPANGRSAANPSRGISVVASGGTIMKVTAEADGVAVPGSIGHGGTRWHSEWPLATRTSYTVEATAVDDRGRPVTATSAFRTLVPARSFRATIFEGDHQTYGVGMPIMLTFDQPISNRKAVERALEVRTSKPVVGAWYWDGSRSLQFRPRNYWPPNTTVHFIGHLDGVEAAPGVYGTHTLTQTFDIGRSLIVVASTASHHVRVYLDRKLFGNWPMSSGKPGDDTPNGTYLTIAKTNPEHMVGPGYDLMVPFSVRFTWSGDFLHDAYWSVNQQGFENVSHGCINLSPANAQTYYNLAVPGDPVTVTDSPRAGVWDNGWTVWFLSWNDLVEGSALGRAVQTGPHGSEFVRASDLTPSKTAAPLRGPEPGNAAAD